MQGPFSQSATAPYLINIVAFYMQITSNSSLALSIIIMDQNYNAAIMFTPCHSPQPTGQHATFGLIMSSRQVYLLLCNINMNIAQLHQTQFVVKFEYCIYRPDSASGRAQHTQLRISRKWVWSRHTLRASTLRSRNTLPWLGGLPSCLFWRAAAVAGRIWPTS